MLEKIIYLLKDFPPEVTIFLTAMLPVSELRGSIPLGFALGLPLKRIVFLSLLGNILPIPFILIFLRPVSKHLRKIKYWKKFFDWLFKRTQEKSKIIERYEFWGLVIFVGIPLPMTGAWTGAIASSLLGIRFNKAILGIFLGIMIAGLIVTFLVLSGKMFISFSFKY